MLASGFLAKVAAAVPAVGGANLQIANVPFLTTPLSFTALGSTIVLPPMAGYKIARGNAVFVLMEKDGTITTAPTVKVGTTSSHDNVCAAQTVATFVSQATNTIVTLVSLAPANVNIDLAAHGLIVEVTAAAVLNTATFLRGRIIFLNMQVAAY